MHLFNNQVTIKKDMVQTTRWTHSQIQGFSSGKNVPALKQVKTTCLNFPKFSSLIKTTPSNISLKPVPFKI